MTNAERDLITKIKIAISVEEYFVQYIDSNSNIVIEKKECCPFHHENTPSFSVKGERWRCWGKCGIGGDVIDLHKVNKKLSSREEAIESLRIILKLDKPDMRNFSIRSGVVQEDIVEYTKEYNIALVKANDAKSYLELDYIMSQYKSKSELTIDLREFNLSH